MVSSTPGAYRRQGCWGAQRLVDREGLGDERWGVRARNVEGGVLLVCGGAHERQNLLGREDLDVAGAADGRLLDVAERNWIGGLQRDLARADRIRAEASARRPA